jgi:hypothetical protein
MRTVEVSTGERATGIDLELRPGLDLAGRVEDANGRGIEGVQIKAIARGGAESAIRTEITGPAGDFVFLGFERGSNVQLSIDDPNVYFQRREAVTLDSEVPPYVTIVAGRAAEIEGTVRDEQGSPVSGVAVHAVPISSRDSRTWYSRTEPSGSFRIVGLPPGEYRIACLNSYSKAVQLEEGQIQEGVALLYPGPKPLLTSGRVVDELGRPVANAQIQGSLGIEFITNSDGRFEIPGLPEGQHSYYVWVPRHTSRSATITAGRTNQDIVVASSGRVTGRVIDARTGAPVTNYTIAVHGQNHVQAVNDPAGEFTMYPGGGTAGLVVRAHGYAHTLHAIAPLAANETRVGLIISLQPGSTLSGMVVNSDGMAVPNAAVSARGLSTTADHSTGTTSDYFGRFVLQGVPIGSIEVAVMCNGYEPVTETIKIANGAANEVTVTLHPTTN